MTTLHTGDCIDIMRGMEAGSVDLILGSPPYLEARTYGIGAQRKLDDWITWMLDVTREAVRVSRGLVLWVCAGQTKDWCYQPGPEGLLYRWVASGGVAWRPCYWRRVGIPGSGGKQWYRADVEYVLAFTGKRGMLPYGDPKINGHPPRWAPGGTMSHRVVNGVRVNQWGHSIDSGATVTDGDLVRSRGRRPSHQEWGRVGGGNGTPKPNAKLMRQPSGSLENQSYAPPAIANPGNVVAVKVGGGHLGHKLAHANEAPYPVKLCEWFIRAHCPEGGTVLDPFSGSGTTGHAAINLGRRYIGIDIRESQTELARRRLAEVGELFQANP